MMLVPFDRSHLQLINVQESQRETLNHHLDYLHGYGNYLEQFSNSFTAFHNGKVVGMAGVETKWTGVGFAWALFADDMPSYKYYVYKEIKKNINKLLSTTYHRIEACTQKGIEKDYRFIQSLGFKEEGVLRKSGFDGSDWVIHATIREDT